MNRSPRPGYVRADLSSGRPQVAIPGPSIIPDRVLAAMHRPMPDLYEGELVDVANAVRNRLPSLAFTDGEAFLLNGNGHGAWQMATSNTLNEGDTVLVVSSRFADSWGSYTEVSGVNIEVLDTDSRRPAPPEALQARLAADDGKITAVLCVHTDTASSVRNDIPALRAAIDAAGHDALFMVDCIASFGCEPFYMDEWGVDVTVAACQKGLMVPPGVSFVWASQKALDVHRRQKVRVGYLDWTKRLDPSSFYMYFAGTPPVGHIFGLDAAFAIIEEEGGLPAVWERHRVLADATRAAVEAWSTPGAIEFNVTDPDARSNAVTSVRTGSIDAEQLRARARRETGLVIGLGLAEAAGVRIAHMGHLNPPMHLGTLGTIEAVLKAQGAPLGGSGVAAATEVIAAALGTS